MTTVYSSGRIPVINRYFIMKHKIQIIEILPNINKYVLGQLAIYNLFSLTLSVNAAAKVKTIDNPTEQSAVRTIATKGCCKAYKINPIVVKDRNPHKMLIITFREKITPKAEIIEVNAII